MNTIKDDKIRQSVRSTYKSVVSGDTGCCKDGECSGASVCGCNSGENAGKISRLYGYSDEERSAVPENSDYGLGCGNPQAIASLKTGETVLDLGSGAGFDAFLAARTVGSEGWVIGVDMTPEMVSKARQNAAKSQFSNVEFRLGEIEQLPVADSSIDVIISNCVVNLCPDKPSVFNEASRVLRPGGRLAISDIVALAPIPESLIGDWELYTGCVAGASTIDEIESMLVTSGFGEIRISRKGESQHILNNWFPGRRIEDYVASATIEARKPL